MPTRIVHIEKNRYASEQEVWSHRCHILDDPDGDDRRPSNGALKHHCIASRQLFC
jgi:hypothetical protein